MSKNLDDGDVDRAVKDAQQLAGRTENNRWVNFDGPARLIGHMVDVTITEALPNSLRGRLRLAEPAAGLAEVEALAGPSSERWLPWRAARAHLLAALGRAGEARAAFDAALKLEPAPAERLYLEARRDALA